MWVWWNKKKKRCSANRQGTVVGFREELGGSRHGSRIYYPIFKYLF
jgi:hypothetical protein